MTISDHELLERWRAGDLDAGEMLFDRYYRTVERFFLNKVSGDIADLAQETFIACVEGRDRLKDSRKFRSYLFAVAHNVLRAHLRAKYRANDQIDFDEVCVRDMSSSQTSLIARRREQKLLIDGLRAIPLDYQVLLELHYWEQMTTADMAEVLDMPLGTVRGRLRRARELLEVAMGQLAQSPQEFESTMTRLDEWAAQCREQMQGSEGSSTGS